MIASARMFIRAEHDAYNFGKAFAVRQCERAMMKKIVAYVDDATFTKVHYASN